MCDLLGTEATLTIVGADIGSDFEGWTGGRPEFVVRVHLAGTHICATDEAHSQQAVWDTRCNLLLTGDPLHIELFERDAGTFFGIGDASDDIARWELSLDDQAELLGQGDVALASSDATLTIALD